MLMKKSNDTIENRTCNLVTQCLNQLCHHVPLLVVAVVIVRGGKGKGKGKVVLCAPRRHVGGVDL